jgi:hypothetical protein
MTEQGRLSELQRRIAVARGWTDLVPHAAGMSGVRYPDEGIVIVPRWPWDMADAWGLVDEMMQHPDTLNFTAGMFTDPADPAYFDLDRWSGLGTCLATGATLSEAIAECWLKWFGVDVSDLQRQP